jgi:hypothetical protein
VSIVHHVRVPVIRIVQIIMAVAIAILLLRILLLRVTLPLLVVVRLDYLRARALLQREFLRWGERWKMFGVLGIAGDVKESDEYEL